MSKKKKKNSQSSINLAVLINGELTKVNKEDLSKLIRDEVVKSIKENTVPPEKKAFISSGREELKDYMFYTDKAPKIIGRNKYYYIEHLIYSNKLFIRAVATKFLFDSIDFSKTIFENCYLRDCRFISCNFEGAKFIGCNLNNSYFENCNFDYATFEKSFIDEEILECAPKNENLKYKFARSLRLNYASLGDNIAVSKAIKVEIAATKKHLLDSWSSGDEWHQKKYGGLKKRTIQFIKWIKFSLLDFLWGNGESLWKLVKSNLYLFFFLTLWDMFLNQKYSISELLITFTVRIPSKYFGLNVIELNYYPQFLEMSLIVIRLISFGLFMSILVKKYNKR